MVSGLSASHLRERSSYSGPFSAQKAFEEEEDAKILDENILDQSALDTGLEFTPELSETEPHITTESKDASNISLHSFYRAPPKVSEFDPLFWRTPPVDAAHFLSRFEEENASILDGNILGQIALDTSPEFSTHCPESEPHLIAQNKPVSHVDGTRTTEPRSSTTSAGKSSGEGELHGHATSRDEDIAFYDAIYPYEHPANFPYTEHDDEDILVNAMTHSPLLEFEPLSDWPEVPSPPSLDIDIPLESLRPLSPTFKFGLMGQSQVSDEPTGDIRKPHTSHGNLVDARSPTHLQEYCAHTDSGYASLGRITQPQAKEGVSEDVSDDLEDSATVYSVANSVCQDDMEMYTSEFAETLADFVSSEIRGAKEDAALVQTVAASISQHLRAFSLRLGCSGTGKAEREVMYFIHKHRGDIASKFQSALILDSQSSDSEESSKPREKANLPAIHSFISEWLDNLGREDEHHDVSRPTLDMDESCDVLSETGEPSNQILLMNQHDYTKIVFESVAYRWLTASIKKEILLALVPSERNPSSSVYAEVVRHLDCGRKRVSSRRSSDMYTLKLLVDWDPKTFLRQEFGNFQGSLGQLLSKTITLTGSATDAQALPCEAYLHQTWPVSGPGLLALLARALDSSDEAEGTLPDKTQVRLKLNPGFQVEVRGTSDSIGEVAEQIAWLGSALRATGPRISETEGCLSLCSPTIDFFPGSRDATLSFRTEPISRLHETANAGRCWHQLFWDPCIAVGYPIPRRSKYGSGLEIPLNMMACLAQSSRIDQWFGKRLLKGFSTIAVPTRRLDDAIVWHLYCSDDERIPYPDPDNIQCADIELEEIAKGRHILGWCSEAQFYAGSKDVNYSIKESGLKTPGKDFSLEKVSFSVGQIVTGGCQFSIGRKDSPIRITRKGYVDKLRWIRQRYFTFYDIDDNRGYLIDGASTLLHLLRASLHLCSLDEFAGEFLFEHSKFQESPDPLKPNSALKALVNHSNRRLPLYREDETTFTTVQDRIEQLYETLEKLVDHAHYSEAAHKGVNVKPRISNHLKGWDFTDLASGRDPFHLRVASLPLAVNWVDFTRSIPAVTVFGRGFGQLIRPTAHLHQPGPACLDWMALPRDQYHLCVGVSDLRDIVQRIGGDASTTSHLTLAPGLVCYNNTGIETFGGCAGERAEAAARSRFRQAGVHPTLELSSAAWTTSLFPSATGDVERLDLDACPGGAVILSGAPTWKWPWHNLSPPAPSETVGSSAAVASPVAESAGRSASSNLSTEFDPASAGSGSRSATPPTSIASGASGAGDVDPAWGDLGPAGSGKTRRKWWSSGDVSSEGSGLRGAGGGKRRKLLCKVRSFVDGAGEMEKDLAVDEDVEMGDKDTWKPGES